MTSTPEPARAATLDARDVTLLQLALKDSCRAPGGFTHVQNLLYWDRYSKLVGMGLLEQGIRYNGIGIYRLTPLALAMFAPAPRPGDGDPAGGGGA